MADWNAYYASHTASPEEAVGLIRSGDRVVVGHACGEPSCLLDALVQNAAAYENVEIVHMVAMGKAEYCRPEYAGAFRSLRAGGTSPPVSSGRCPASSGTRTCCRWTWP
mgnify:CR=1 FL=1